MTRPTLIATLTLAALFALPAAAQHAGHAMPAAAASSPSTAAYQAANWLVIHRPGAIPSAGLHRVAEVIGSRLLVDKI